MAPPKGHDLRPSRGIADFLRAPFGRYVVRRAFCFWQLDKGSNGVIVWGAPDVDDVREMTEVFDVVFHPEFGWHVSLVDTRGITVVDAKAFERLLLYLESRQEAYGRCVRKQALVVNRALFGATLAGLHQLLGPPYPTAAFTDPDAAIAWLEPEDPEKMARTFAALHDELFSVPEIVARLRALLATERRPPTLGAAARKLAVSPRTLQRRLGEAGTSLRKEIESHRLRLGEQLLSETSEHVRSVAAALGFSSEAQLERLFRRARGLSPTDIRARVTGA